MYVPSADSLMAALNASKADLNGNGRIEVPARLLKLLLQIALATSEFDEQRYLAENPDVAKAIERGEIESAHMHYLGYGYFEGRKGSGPVVDTDWYLAKYPDVANAVRDGRLRSAEAHFHTMGGGEGRSPAADYEAEAAQWKAAIKGQ
ncbi:hypothetical protein LQG66_21155 [Bradyrhizobium ontarionense]|uniref:DUF4274 domain-containing protein n=1 Tax=Bradyrhizobium ontarionense TaxID=2898149 RepID=A0ABY3R505_9BRAD|nr:hypothetical protein [Bradyrhizobium sp. A19]UFZ01822.1 hypothetical protein LQG66_21155 [Bradyrhizobium sp. A19]